MAVRIAQASRGESGYVNQQAGNQSGSELNIRTWYIYPNGGWDTLIRAKSPIVAEKIARAFEQAVKNPNVGYDMNLADRRSLYNAAKAVGWNISAITKKVECDCSSLAATAINCAGVTVSEWLATGTMSSAVQKTGQFDILRDPKYLTSDAYLKRGDLLMNTQHHICCVLDNGSMAVVAPQTGKAVSYAVQVSVNTFLNVRTGASANSPIMQVNGKDFVLPNGIVVAICEELNGWGRINDINGWISLTYTKR